LRCIAGGTGAANLDWRRLAACAVAQFAEVGD
jgi:hypothetical protein